MSTEKINAITFDADFGATITIPIDQVSVYATTKAGQLASLNKLIHDHTAGFQIELTESDMFAFTGLASELAHACSKVVMTATKDMQNEEARDA
jgi:hypothetical protein